MAERPARAAAALRGAVAGAGAHAARGTVVARGADTAMSWQLAAIISVSSSLGYALPAIIGLESMGIPSPGETALVLASVLASQGKLHIWLVLVIGISSAIIGDNIGYWLGRKI